MSRPFPLQAVLDLMRSRNDAATQRLASLIAAERDARKTLAMLLQYRDEYTTRFRQAVQDGLDQPEWRNYQQFLDRLDEAVRQQEQTAKLKAAHTAAGQAEWQRQRSRLNAFDTLSERHRTGEARRELRHEQKLQDEFAARGRDDQQEQ
ncbi:MAG: Flagellar FliJ protein [Candidatus Accumulibacter sp. BA-94]|uniref:flagellar export protein FliJ n=1 Tax=Accumulibacter sp. TaxID=2053492 RepID=UPI0004497A92|nr:flagellar export protein FliJ [Accumulibacter sp.]EXI84487.1 MAG: Flagellar FliJ protein [Candidatus Accumulibacter sp. BA-94]MBL8392627.1 flagellar export protein FliJ [Accumulibacter sp.]HRD88522.1 flagellar export protein FliJ [Accumulibacter sp.]